jgi:hypothetical protein
MLFTRNSGVFRCNPDSESSAGPEMPAQNVQVPLQPEKQPLVESDKPADGQADAEQSTLGENWPPNLRSHETDWFVMPEPEPTKEKDRPLM